MQPELSKASSAFKLHHIGIVVPSISEKRNFYVDVLGYSVSTEVIHDPVQTAFVQFFAVPGSDHYLELVAPDGEGSKLSNASRKGIPLNHLCYSCEDTAVATDGLMKAGCYIIQAPEPAVAFEGRLISWLITPDRLLIELVACGLDNKKWNLAFKT